MANIPDDLKDDRHLQKGSERYVRDIYKLI